MAMTEGSVDGSTVGSDDAKNALTKLVEENAVFREVNRTDKRGKTHTERYLTHRFDELTRRKEWKTIARGFIAECRENDLLRARAEAQGIDVEAFEDNLDNADS